jgi:hypothetical protein
MSKRKGKIEISSWKVGEAENFWGLSFDENSDVEPTIPENDGPEPEQPIDE